MITPYSLKSVFCVKHFVCTVLIYQRHVSAAPLRICCSQILQRTTPVSVYVPHTTIQKHQATILASSVTLAVSTASQYPQNVHPATLELNSAEILAIWFA